MRMNTNTAHRRLKTMGRKAQLGPQGLEDLPMAVMAFIIGIAVLIIFFSIVNSRLTEAEVNDMHDTGKRIVEELSGEVFQSEESGSYGNGVLDIKVISKLYAENKSLKNIIGPIEYGFWASIGMGLQEWQFGSKPPKDALAYGGAVTILSGDLLYDGEIIVKIWPK